MEAELPAHQYYWLHNMHYGNVGECDSVWYIYGYEESANRMEGQPPKA